MLNPADLVFGLAGFVWGVAADRIAARWPEHETTLTRPLDWRTAVSAIIGALVLGSLPGAFAERGQLALFTAYAAGLVLLLATDLDQRLMPDLVTLPLIALAGIAAVAGLDPFTSHDLLPAVAAAVIVPGALFVMSIPFGSGAFGLGDVKLLISVGLLVGLGRTVGAVFVGALLSGVVILVLMAARRITLRSYIPFGPFLILGTAWAILLRA